MQGMEAAGSQAAAGDVDSSHRRTQRVAWPTQQQQQGYIALCILAAPLIGATRFRTAANCCCPGR